MLSKSVTRLVTTVPIRTTQQEFFDARLHKRQLQQFERLENEPVDSLDFGLPFIDKIFQILNFNLYIIPIFFWRMILIFNLGLV
jgi:hypothetical protein